MIPWFKHNWAFITATVTFVGVVVGIVANAGTIIQWLTPQPAFEQNGPLFGDFVDSKFHWPNTYDASDDERKKFFHESVTLLRLTLHNIDKTAVTDAHLNLPGEGIVEISRKGIPVAISQPADSIAIGDLPPGEQATILIWMKRPFVAGEIITFTSSTTTVQIKPSLFMDLADITFYKRGYYAALSIVGLLSLTLSIVVGRFMQFPPARQPQLTAASS